MKLHQERGTVERGGVQTEHAFTIKTTAKAFDILSSGLYSDNKLAIVRELSCNAYDSHVEAGKADVPFEIHLPSSMEPYFEVKDFGLGLCERDVLELYTTYFESTKTNSNDYIGALGLGSKSPFSYTNSFEVTSRWNGMRMMFAVFLNDDGIPTIAKMGEIATDEPNGLAVKFTVKKDDFWAFRNKTESALMYFPFKPTITNCTGFAFDKQPETRFEGNGWYISEASWNNNKFVAVQGNVPYRVDISKITENMEKDEGDFFDAAVITVFFDIGDVEVAASREEIRYNDQTIKTLVERARKVRSELTGIIEEKAKAIESKSFWDTCCELDALSKQIFGKDHYIRKFVDETVVTYKPFKQYLETSGSVFLTLDEFRWHEIVGYVEPKYGSNSLRLTRQKIGDVINPKKSIGLLEMDMTIGGVSRAAAWLNEQPDVTRLIVVKPLKEERQIPTKGRKITREGEMKKIRKQFGSPTMLKVTSLPIVAPIRTYARTTGSMFTYNGIRDTNRRYHRSSDPADWLKQDLNKEILEQGGLFFVMRNGTRIMAPMLDGKELRMDWNGQQVREQFSKIVKALNHHNGTEHSIQDIKGISALHAKKVKGDPKWINIFEATRALVPHYQAAIEHEVRVIETPETLGLTELASDDKFIAHIKELDDESTFRKMVMPLIEGHEAHKDINGIAAILREVDSRWGANLFVNVDCDPYFEDSAFDVYPMLRFVGSIISDSNRKSYQANTDLNVLFDYIKQRDAIIAAETK